MSEINIIAHKLKIFIDTNIPNKTEPIIFTRNLLYNPNTIVSNISLKNIGKKISSTEFPFFNKQYKYPKSILNNLSYDKCVSFFFDKKTFINILNTHIIKEYIIPSKNNEEAREIIDFNINTMIELLFPTKYPIINNHYDSYTNNILGLTSGLSFKGSLGVFEKILPTNFKTNYSYIQFDNKKYSVVKTTILNDIFNHPGYRSMIDSYNKINLKKMEYNINKRIEVILKQFSVSMEKFRKYNFFTDLKRILEKVLNNESLEEQRIRYKIDVIFISEYIKLLNELILNNNNLDESITNMETMTYKTEKLSMYIPTKINNKIKEIKDIITKIHLLKHIFEKHFENGVININFDKKIESFMKENYKNYYNFGKELLNNTKFKSTNTDLQEILDDFTNNNDDNDDNDDAIIYFSHYMKIISQILDGKIMPKDVPYTNNFYVGMRYYDDDDDYDDVYEAYVKIDVFGGILNDNINIGCDYRGEVLGDIFDKKNNSSWKAQDGIYIDIDELIKKNIQPPIQNKTNGGKYTKRRRIIHNNTRRK